jgi:hypothetical protein
MGVFIVLNKIISFFKSEHKKTDRQTRNLLIAQIQNELRIAKESAELVNSSKNIDVVLNRYGLLVDKLLLLSQYENTDLLKGIKMPSETLKDIKLNKIKIFNQAIQRAYEDMLNKTSKLKTQKGRENRIRSFFMQLTAYKDMFEPDNMKFIEKLKSKHSMEVK